MYELETFRQFHDHPESPFYRTPTLTEVQTWTAIYDAMCHTLAELAQRAKEGNLVVAKPLLVEMHRRLFVMTFPDDAGRVRGTDDAGQLEEVSFAIDVGTARTRHRREIRGTTPPRIEDNLDEAFERYRSDVAALGDPARVGDFVRVAGRLYVRLLRIHPFIDGNLRAVYLVLQAALLAVGLPLIEFADFDAHAEAVDVGLRGDARQSYEPIGDLLEAILKEGGVISDGKGENQA